MEHNVTQITWYTNFLNLWGCFKNFSTLKSTGVGWVLTRDPWVIDKHVTNVPSSHY